MNDHVKRKGPRSKRSLEWEAWLVANPDHDEKSLLPEPMEERAGVLERWEKIPGYDYHFISSLGRVSSIPHFTKNTRGFYRFHEGRILTPQPGRNGYPTIGLNVEGITKPKFIHILMARAFLGEPNGREVNHKDFNRANYHLSNLEYVTHKENINHSLRAGRYARKLSPEEALDIFRSDTNRDLLCVKYGVTKQMICRIKSKRSWKRLHE